MNHEITEHAWLEDFKDFVGTKGTVVPEELSQKILARVHKDLHPSAWLVFSKLLAIHSVVGTLSLAICDQFGMNPFNTGFSLSTYFMKFGHSMCMTLCGFLFLSLTVLLGRAILRQEEFLVLKNNLFIQIPFLSLLSLVTFVGFGAEVVIGTLAFWLLGAFIGGVITTKILSARAHSSHGYS